MKTHTSIGAAKQSLAHRCGPTWRRTGWTEGFILELVDGEWYVRYHVKNGTKPEDLPWKTDAWAYNGSSYYQRPYIFHEPTYGKENYKKVRINRPETKEEYAEWRIKVELERRGLSVDSNESLEKRGIEA